MKAGIQLHPERGIDAVFEEAQAADRQGFDSMWAGDHLMNREGTSPDLPMDSWTLMSALGGATTHIRLAWSVLNLGFRKPALLAKMLATLDRVTHGRVICSVGSGSNTLEYGAYDIPLTKDHDDRVTESRETVQLFKQLWTHPAPERTSFEGRFVRTQDLAFCPSPVQQPHPPIWVGGDSPATLSIVRDLADGWVVLSNRNPDTVAAVTKAADWPQRPLVVVAGARVFVAPTRQQALDEAGKVFERGAGLSGSPKTLQDFVAREIVGTPDECLARIKEMEGYGINYLRFVCDTPDQQQRAATVLLPRL